MAGSVATNTARTAVVAGGGPVGAVAAIMLAQQGWHVQVFDQADFPSIRPHQHDNRAYRLSLMPRALRVFKLAHVNIQPLVAAQGGLMEATWFKPNGQVKRFNRIQITKDPQCVRGYRDEIAFCVVKEAQRLHSESIRFHFNSPVVRVDLDKQTVSASLGGSKTTEVPYDLLIGADGAGSVVRSALEQVMPTDFVRRYRHKQMYSMAQVTPSNPEDIPQHAVLQGHIMANREGMVFWDGQGSNDCRVGLTLPLELAETIRQGNPDTVAALLDRSCPALPHYARKGVMELVHSKPDFYPMPSWTHLSQLHGPKVLLLGDAAHTMSPVLGQGLNSGLEDVAVFAQCLEEHQGNVGAALPAYNKARLPDIQAVMTMNEVIASSDAGLASQDQSVAHKAWLFGHKMLLITHFLSRMMLHKVAPNVFAGSCMMPLMQGTSPYRTFKSALYRDGIWFAGFLFTVAGLGLHLCI